MTSRRTRGFWHRVRNWRFRQGNPSYGDPTDDTPERAAEKEHDPERSRPSQGGFDRPLGPLMGGPFGSMGGSG
jgi:hypothetical protein